MSPAGEMWSVVTESPTKTRQRAPLIGRAGGGSSLMPSKKGGFWMYVDLGFHLYRPLLETGTRFQVSLPVKTLAYCTRNCSGVTHFALSVWTSAWVGQMSFRYTGLPSRPGMLEKPIGSVARSISTVPAMA